MNSNNKNIFIKLTNAKITIPTAFKIVFSNRLYIAISICVFAALWVIFNVFDQLLFFSPVTTFYLPDDAINGFVMTNISSILIGILISMNVYVIRNSNLRLDRSIVTGSFVGIISSACVSCSSIGFLIISAFGGFGIVVTDFLTNYQILLRLLSIGILTWALYSVHNRIINSCVSNTFTDKRGRQ